MPNGELIGINTAVLAKNLGVEGIGFAIPVNLVRGVMSEILTKGRVVRGWIGIVPADIDDNEAQRFNLPQPGVVVAKLYDGQPGRAGGHGAARHDPHGERREGAERAGRAARASPTPSRAER